MTWGSDLEPDQASGQQPLLGRSVRIAGGRSQLPGDMGLVPDAVSGDSAHKTLPAGFQGRQIKVLLVCHWFPPSNVIGAIRVGKFAKYLHDSGHEIRVLTADNPGDHSLPLEIPANRVTYVTARRLDAIYDPVIRLMRRRPRRPTPAPSAQWIMPARPTLLGRVAAVLRRHYYALLRIPDARAGWMHAAIPVGYEIVRDWRPDIVLASGPPHSGLIAARRIARACGAPWIAELRDLWADAPYYEYPRWRLYLDRRIERSVLNSAVGLVTVSPIWAETLRRHYRQPVACVLNGYAEEDFTADRPGPPPGQVVSIVYTGNIYAGYRDPSALFRAIDLLGVDRRWIAVHFYGPAKDEVYGLSAAQPVRDQIVVHDPVSYQASLSLQTSADVLLLLQWADARDAGNIPAKFFEYIGARRPILLIGYEHGNLADMIREREAGLVSNDPSVIAAQLRRWITQRPAGIMPIDAKAREGLTRAIQFAKLERFLVKLAKEGNGAAPDQHGDLP